MILVEASFDCVEMFAGDRAITRCVRAGGYCCASLDIEYWNAWKATKTARKTYSSNPLDLLSASGFAMLGCITKCGYIMNKSG